MRGFLFFLLKALRIILFYANIIGY